MWTDSEEEEEEAVRKIKLVKEMQEEKVGTHLVEVRDEDLRGRGVMEKRMQGILRFAATELLENAVATRDDKLACSAMHMSVRQIMKILNATEGWVRERKLGSGAEDPDH